MSRTVVVTGASGGIGRASAQAFAAHGDSVALLARGEDGLTAAEKEITNAGGRAMSVPVDVADADAVFAAAERVERELGSIDVWVNVAFSSVFAPFWEIKPEEYRRATATGPPVYSEEYDARQHQMRGNLPQAFVHALMVEAAARLNASPEKETPSATHP